MTKEQLINKIKELFRTDADLKFLFNPEKEELETLIVCVRDRISS